jgi:signal transduction histidine kinase
LVVVSLAIASALTWWSFTEAREDVEALDRATAEALGGLDGEQPERLAAHREEVARGFRILPIVLAGALVFVLAHVAGAVLLLRSEIARRAEREEERARLLELHRQLMGMVGHDLRSPLAAVITSAEALTRVQGLPGPCLRGANRILRSGHRMASVTRDLMDFADARIGGSLEIQPRPLDIRELCQHAIRELQSQEYSGRVVQAEHRGAVAGEWDPKRLEQIVTHLLSNALRHGDPSAPVQLVTQAAGGRISIAVRNEGPPIAEELRRRLFEPFERGGEARDLRRSVGLGLFIVKALAAAHGGGVSVSSGPEGTTFRVDLPLRASPPGQVDRRRHPRLQPGAQHA